MSEVIGYCGLDCSKCDAFKATKAEDLAWKTEIAKRWTRELNIEFKPEDTNCKGCTSDVISGWCTRICKMRPCAKDKKVKTCAHCKSYRCERLQGFLSKEPEAERRLEEIRKTFTI